MPVVAFMNMKGGVGKTTLCVNLADILSRSIEGFNRKILVIDIDPQFNATQCFMSGKEYISYKKAKKKTVFNIYGDNYFFPSLVEGQNEECVRVENLNDIICIAKKNLHFIPGDLQLIKAESGRNGQERRLKRFIEKFNLKEQYDYIFIDCPPTNSLWTLSAIIAADYYVLPVKPDHLSSVGLSLFTSVVGEAIEDYGCDIKCGGIVYTMVPNNNLAKQVMSSISAAPKYSDKVFSGVMRHTVQIARIQQRRRFIADLANEHTSDIIRIGREFVERIEVNAKIE